VLDFKTWEGVLHGVRILNSLPMVMTLSRVEGTSQMAVRMYLPRAQMNNLFTMLSAMSRQGILAGFTYVLLDPMTIKGQTFAYKYFEDGTGWRYDNLAYFDQLRKLSSTFDKEDTAEVTFQTALVSSFQ
jgi:hypothetical protein